MIPNPKHRCRDVSARSPSTHHPSLRYGSCFRFGGTTRVICIRISPCFKFIAKKSLGPFFPALPQSTRVPYSVTSLLHSWPRDMLATPAWAMAIPFRECSFVMLVPLRILPASLVYAYQHLLRYGTTVPTLHTMPISHFSLVFAVALGFEIMC